MKVIQKWCLCFLVLVALYNPSALPLEKNITDDFSCEHVGALPGRVNLDPVEVDHSMNGAGPSVVSDELPWRDCQCGICLDPENPLLVCLLHNKGFHIFHKDCLLRWLRYNEQLVAALTCPSCRHPLSIQDVIMLPEHTAREVWELMKMGEEDELARKMREIIAEQRRHLEVEYMGEEDGVSRSIRIQEREQNKRRMKGEVDAMHRRYVRRLNCFAYGMILSALLFGSMIYFIVACRTCSDDCCDTNGGCGDRWGDDQSSEEKARAKNCVLYDCAFQFYSIWGCLLSSILVSGCSGCLVGGSSLIEDRYKELKRQYEDEFGRDDQQPNGDSAV